MSSDNSKRPNDRVLVAIPAFNEEGTIASVVEAVRRSAPDFDLLVINDGSRDRTGEILAGLGVITATHLCNLGYGRALQTALQYALRHGYSALMTFDADGQHQADDLIRLHRAFGERGHDLLIGSRFVRSARYAGSARSRAAGMWAFSMLVRLMTGRRIYDTTSGFRVFGRATFELLSTQPFADFHAETIVLLLRRGYSVGEEPIAARERQAGVSMYSRISAVKYPLKTSLAAFVAFLGSGMTDRK